jgi:predicted dehydrogenase
VRFAVVGCGNVAARYAQTLPRHPQVELVGATDLVRARAEAFVDAFGGRCYGSLDDVLADPAVEAVLVLTVPAAHAEVVRRSLRVGKHVHTEKPLALGSAEAWQLVADADAAGLRLASSPVTFLGDAQLALARLVRQGRLGRVRLAYAEANWGRIERWHPDPESLYDVGVLVDVGIYPVTLLTALFGPVRRVTAAARTLDPDRRTLDGRSFHPGRPDFVVAVLDLEDGPTVRLTASFYPEPTTRGRGIELHGDEASAYLESWQRFDSALALAPRGEEYAPVPVGGDPFAGVDLGLAAAELADAVREGRPHRTGPAHAAHVVEVLEAVYRSSEAGTPLEISSSFPPPDLPLGL